MSLKRRITLYTFISSTIIITLYSIITFFTFKQLAQIEGHNEYERILNLYTFGRQFSLAKDEFAKDDLQAFKALSLFIKEVNNLKIVFIYDINLLRKTLKNFEEFLEGKVIFEHFALEGDIPKDKNLLEVALETETYSIYGYFLRPVFVYTYPIYFDGSVIGKVAFYETFHVNAGLLGGLYLFAVLFTLVNMYLPVHFFSNTVKELNFLSKIANKFSKKDFSNIETLRKNIRKSEERNELYELKVAILKMVESLDQHIRQLQKERQSFENLAFTDPLTGLYNRRMFLEIAKKNINEAKRYNEPLSLIMLDIDHFKRINDTYGHDIGDVVLKFLASILKNNVRASDIIARWGGEEFIILLPKTELKQAYKVAEKIRKIVEMSTIKLPDGERLNFTISLGVSSFGGYEDLEELIKKADIALYEAKRKGRNRTEVYRTNLSL